MTLVILTLTAGFVFVCVLLLSLNLKTSHHWSIKVGMIAVALGFYLITLKTLPGFFGWPTAEHLPDRFLLISYQVQEPENEPTMALFISGFRIWVTRLRGREPMGRTTTLNYILAWKPRKNAWILVKPWLAKCPVKGDLPVRLYPVSNSSRNLAHRQKLGNHALKLRVTQTATSYMEVAIKLEERKERESDFQCVCH